eukprot:10957150-Ditylum_brightwellii.AAC.1
MGSTKEREHVSFTANLQITDKSKFSVSTPKRQDSAYLHIWDTTLQTCHQIVWEAGIPSSRRILEDMHHIPTYSIVKCFEAHVIAIHGLGSHCGRRALGREDDRVGENWGATREKPPPSPSH